MIRPELDGRLALRLREMADYPLPIEPDEMKRILHLTADLLEEYIMAHAAQVSSPSSNHRSK